MRATLYVIRGSHACRTAQLMLDHKAIGYRLVHLPTGSHPVAVRLLGFDAPEAHRRTIDGRMTPSLALANRLGVVPALRLDGKRSASNRAIARLLDRVKPEPRLLPEDPGRRAAVEAAERWGDEVLQMVARRLVLIAGAAGRLRDDGGSGRLGPLLYKRTVVRRLAVRMIAPTFAAGSRAEAALLEELPALLDRVDGWLADGTLGAAQLTAADFMIAPSLALLSYREDAAAALDGRSAGRFLERLLPLRAG